MVWIAAGGLFLWVFNKFSESGIGYVSKFSEPDWDPTDSGE